MRAWLISMCAFACVVLAGCAGGSSAAPGALPGVAPTPLTISPLSCPAGVVSAGQQATFGPSDVAAGDLVHRCAARATLDAGGLVVADGVGLGAAVQFLALAGATMTSTDQNALPVPSGSPDPALSAVGSAHEADRVAFAHDAQHHLHVYAWFGSKIPSTTAPTPDADFARWKGRLALLGDVPDPSSAPWTQLIEYDIDHTDSHGNTFQNDVTFFRLNTTDTAQEHFLLREYTQTIPSYSCTNYTFGHLNGSGSCGWFTDIRSVVFDTLDTGLTLVEHDPTGTIQTTETTWQIGGGFSGYTPNAGVSYSASYYSSDVTTSDNTTSRMASWSEQFTGPHACGFDYCQATATATGTFYSLQAATFNAPVGQQEYRLFGKFFTEMEDSTDLHDDGSLSCPFICWSTSYEGSTGVGFLAIPTPEFGVSPQSLTLSAAHPSATVAVTAAIPGSSQGLAWGLTYNQSGVTSDVQPGTTYAGSRTVTFTLEPGTPVGTVVDVGLNTTPAFAARSVVSGALTLQITVVP